MKALLARRTTPSPERKSTRGPILYLVVAFTFAWAVWFVCQAMYRHGTPGADLVSLVIVGSFAPFLASGLAVWYDSGARAALRFYRRGLNWRMGWLPFAVSLLGAPLAGVAIAGAFSMASSSPLTFLTSWKEVPYVYVFLMILGGPLAEEFGWSYLSDRLDERLAPFLSSLVLGVIWALWHLPLFYVVVPGLTQRFTPFPVFLVTVVCYRFLMAWCYHRSGHNILSNLLAHNGFNVASSLVPIILPVYGTMQWRLVAVGGVTGLLAIALYHLSPVTPRAPALETVQE